MEPLRIRVHNERAFKANVAGHKMDYLDPEMEKMLRDIDRKHASETKVKNG